MALFPIHAIVRRFFGDDHIVHVAFPESGYRLTDEGGILLQVGNRLASAIAHSGFQSADELIDDCRQRSLVGHATLDAFRHELLRRTSALTVSITAASFHGPDRSHPSVDLIRSRLVEHGFSR